jgi:hypothetical protein
VEIAYGNGEIPAYFPRFDRFGSPWPCVGSFNFQQFRTKRIDFHQEREGNARIRNKSLGEEMEEIEKRNPNTTIQKEIDKLANRGPVANRVNFVRRFA